MALIVVRSFYYFVFYPDYIIKTMCSDLSGSLLPVLLIRFVIWNPDRFLFFNSYSDSDSPHP